jgi:hypothetical protein
MTKRSQDILRKEKVFVGLEDCGEATLCAFSSPCLIRLRTVSADTFNMVAA